MGGLGRPHILGKGLTICGQGDVGWVLVVAWAGCLPWDVCNKGNGVVAVGIIVGRYNVDDAR